MLSRPFTGLIALATVTVAGCESASDPATPADVRASSAAVGPELAALREVTARFHRFDEAGAAGYTVLVTHPETGAACLEHPTDGAMGRHFLNPGLVDDDVAITEPEVVIYEPMMNGKQRLVGFEYIIPFAVRGPDETPPTLFEQDFLHNTTFGVWMLHVYAWKRNPSGTFATWNPAITCEHDAAVND